MLWHKELWNPAQNLEPGAKPELLRLLPNIAVPGELVKKIFTKLPVAFAHRDG